MSTLNPVSSPVGNIYNNNSDNRSAGGYFEKWLLRPSGAKFAMAQYPNMSEMYHSLICLPNLEAFIIKCTIVPNFLAMPQHYFTSSHNVIIMFF